MSFIQVLNRSLRAPITVPVRAAARAWGYTSMPSQQMSSRLQGLAQRTTTCQRRLYSDTTKSTTDKTPVIKVPKKGTGSNSWTPELDEQIISLRASNNTWEYISMVIGRPISVCTDRFHTHLDPSLKTWTPTMISKMDQMIEDGATWHEVSMALNHKVSSCRHIWKTQGKGKLRVRGVISTAQPLAWTPQELDAYWRGWMIYGVTDWASISHMVKSKTETECKKKFKVLLIDAVKDAPGWVKMEIFKFVTDTNRITRNRLRQMEILGTSDHESLPEKTIQWTPEDHDALLKAVEKYGLFSGWTAIRKQVKPHLTDMEVEAEYYKLSGVAMKSDFIPRDAKMKTPTIMAEWSKEAMEKFKTMMMKYSSLPAWTEEAAKHGVEASDDDYGTLFGHSTAVPKRLKKSLSLDDSVEPSSSKKSGANWTVVRLARLRRLVIQQQQMERNTGQSMDWSWIAEHIGPGFDASMCITKWQSLPIDTTLQLEPPKIWVDEDFEVLLDGIRAHGKSWKNIQMNFMPERTIESIRRKFSNIQSKRDRLRRELQNDPETFKNRRSGRNAYARDLENMGPRSAFTMMDRIDDALAEYEKLRFKPPPPKNVNGSKDADDKDKI